EVVGHHRLDRAAREDALAAVPTLLEHHAAERKVVVDRRDESASPRCKGRRAAPLALLRVIVKLQHSRLRTRLIAASQAVELFGGHGEARVLHTERPENSLRQEALKWLTRCAGDEHAEHIGPGVINPALARLMHQRQRAETPNP